MKKETLEEAAENYSKGWGENNDEKSFIAGAKWQAERMYSEEDMIEFAKLHVEAALYVASERADLTDNGRFPYVDKASILNSYPLSNIK